jgi:hypothetical protein
MNVAAGCPQLHATRKKTRGLAEKRGRQDHTQPCWKDTTQHCRKDTGDLLQAVKWIIMEHYRLGAVMRTDLKPKRGTKSQLGQVC